MFLIILQGYAFSEDGEYLAYGTSASGSDWVEIHFLRVEDALPLEDRLERVKFSCMSWTHDGKGLFYNSYPDQEGKSDGEAKTACTQTFLNPKHCFSCSHRNKSSEKSDLFASFFMCLFAFYFFNLMDVQLCLPLLLQL